MGLVAAPIRRIKITGKDDVKERYCPNREKHTSDPFHRVVPYVTTVEPLHGAAAMLFRLYVFPAGRIDNDAICGLN